MGSWDGRMKKGRRKKNRESGKRDDSWLLSEGKGRNSELERAWGLGLGAWGLEVALSESVEKWRDVR